MKRKPISMSVRDLNRLLMMLALLAALPTAAAAGEAAPATEGELTFERWYLLRLDGDRIGHSHTAVREASERIITTTQASMSIRRGPMTVSIEQATRFVETVEGEPIEARSRSKMGQMETEQTLRFDGQPEGVVELTTRQAGHEQTREVSVSDEPWLPPAAAQRYVRAQFEQGAEHIELRTLEPSVGHEPFTIMMDVIGEEQVEVLGKVVPAVVWDAELSIWPGMTVREYVDEGGRPLRTTLHAGPGLEVEMIQADRAVATAEVDPPELLTSMFIEPEGIIRMPRRLRSATYELRLEDDVDSDRFDLPQTGYQRVVWGDERTARVVVSVDQPVTAGQDLPRAAHREASMMVGHDDPEVRALVERALGEEAEALDDRAKAERLRAFVHDYVTEKDLSVGFATASEVARTAQGDCTEHAVLLAAMLRAVDIPSRAVTGLLYVEGFLDHERVFGGHMWTQAWLPAQAEGGRTWVDLDATLPERAIDAARITIGVTALSDGHDNELVGMMPLLGALEVAVLDARTGER